MNTPHIPGNVVHGYIQDMDGAAILDAICDNGAAFHSVCQALDYLLEARCVTKKDAPLMALAALQNALNHIENRLAADRRAEACDEY